MASGIIGLFLGAVVLAVAYQVFMEWVDGPGAEPEQAPEAAGGGGEATATAD